MTCENETANNQDRPLIRNLWTTATALVTVAVAVAVAVAVSGGRPAGANNVSPSALQQDDGGAQVYADTCSSCHGIDGSGVPGAIPPLLGNPNVADGDYVETVVREGREGPIEVLGVSYDEAMRGFPDLSDKEVAAVAAYVGTLAEPDTADPAADVAVVEPGTVSEGRQLFVGETRLTNGGGACVGCHTTGDVGNLGGWSLGPDLTNTAATFGTEAALVSWLTAPASPTMAPIFADRPLTADEIADVAVFLGDAPSQSKPFDPGDGLILAGAGGFVMLIGAMAVAWRGMRQTYADRLRSKR